MLFAAPKSHGPLEGAVMSTEATWKGIHMVRGQRNAVRTETALEAEGFLVRVQALPGGETPDDVYYEIAVPGMEAQEAQDLLIERGLLL